MLYYQEQRKAFLKNLKLSPYWELYFLAILNEKKSYIIWHKPFRKDESR